MTADPAQNAHVPWKPAAAAVAGLWLLRLVTAAALAVDAYVHADLAPAYDLGVAPLEGRLHLRELWIGERAE